MRSVISTPPSILDSSSTRSAASSSTTSVRLVFRSLDFTARKWCLPWLATCGKCVTHLPQVASQARHHVRVAKSSDGRTSRTRVERLDADARIEELSRMLGGIEITERTRAHAAEMIDRAAK